MDPSAQYPKSQERSTSPSMDISVFHKEHSFFKFRILSAEYAPGMPLDPWLVLREVKSTDKEVKELGKVLDNLPHSPIWRLYFEEFYSDLLSYLWYKDPAQIEIDRSHTALEGLEALLAADSGSRESLTDSERRCNEKRREILTCGRDQFMPAVLGERAITEEIKMKYQRLAAETLRVRIGKPVEQGRCLDTCNRCIDADVQMFLKWRLDRQFDKRSKEVEENAKKVVEDYDNKFGKVDDRVKAGQCEGTKGQA